MRLNSSEKNIYLQQVEGAVVAAAAELSQVPWEDELCSSHQEGAADNALKIYNNDY